MQNVQKITQAYSQAPWRKQVQWIGTFLLVLVFIWLVAALYLDVTARAATIGREIQELQVGQAETVNIPSDPTKHPSIEELKRRNANLQAQLAYLLSEDTLKTRAVSLGYEPIEPGAQLYVDVPGYIPQQTVILASPPGTTVPGTETQVTVVKSSLLNWVEDQYRLVEKMLK
jgi:hypothetical protein